MPSTLPRRMNHRAKPLARPGLCLLLLPLLAGISHAASPTPLPFEGKWDCQLGTFTFTASSYNPGKAPMEILDIAAMGDTYNLTFEDNYQLSLAMNPDGTMTWYSPVSGDSFLCHPLK